MQRFEIRLHPICLVAFGPVDHVGPPAAHRAVFRGMVSENDGKTGAIREVLARG